VGAIVGNAEGVFVGEFDGRGLGLPGMYVGADEGGEDGMGVGLLAT